MTEELTPRYKIVVVGDGAAGKEKVLYFLSNIYFFSMWAVKPGKLNTNKNQNADILWSFLKSMIKNRCIKDKYKTSWKTSLLQRFAENTFSVEYTPTIFENRTKHIEIEGKRIELALWDTAGQEEYDQIRILAYKNVGECFPTFKINWALVEKARVKMINYLKL